VNAFIAYRERKKWSFFFIKKEDTERTTENVVGEKSEKVII